MSDSVRAQPELALSITHKQQAQQQKSYKCTYAIYEPGLTLFLAQAAILKYCTTYKTYRSYFIEGDYCLFAPTRKNYCKA